MDTVANASPDSERVSDRGDDNDLQAPAETGAPARSRTFEDVDTRSILDQVPAKLQGDAAWSLWRRIDSELATGGPERVTSYLRSEFDRIATKLRRDLAAVTYTE